MPDAGRNSRPGKPITPSGNLQGVPFPSSACFRHSKAMDEKNVDGASRPKPEDRPLFSFLFGALRLRARFGMFAALTAQAPSKNPTNGPTEGLAERRDIVKRTILAVMGVALLAMAGAAVASDTNTLTVSATVTGTCKFSSPTSSLNFGTLDPAVGSDKNVTNTTQV